MENTKENKGKFFAQYWGQQVLCFEGRAYSHKGMTVGRTIKPEIGTYYIELKPLSAITDEDAVEILKICEFTLGNLQDDDFRFMSDVKNWVESVFSFTHNYTTSNCLWASDFLRSRGYALPYNGLSVENQISYGWVRIKE